VNYISLHIYTYSSAVELILIFFFNDTHTNKTYPLSLHDALPILFFGGAQVDAEARLNLTCIGDYARPRVKLPGPAGSSSMRAYVRKVVVGVPRHSTRTLVPRVDFATSVVSPRNLETTVVSDLAVL